VLQPFLMRPMSCAVPAVRYRPIDRSRVSAVSLDQQLPDDHPVRMIWEFVTRLDLSPVVRPAKAVEGHPGAPIIDGRLLFALWLFAVSEGIRSARRLSELCGRDLPYQWLCGGSAVNYHTLADFYADNGNAVQAVFVEHLAALREQGLIDLWQVTVDGRKVLANAAKETFHREPTLQRHLDEARAHLERLQAEHADATATPRQRAARQRAAREREQRLCAAVTQVQQRQQQRQASKQPSSSPSEARASETDADAAKMKMSDGGYRPAYNVQTVTDAPSGLIVTVAVTNQGSDNGQSRPLLEQMHRQQDTLPLSGLFDSGYADHADLEFLEGQGVEVLMPPRDAARDQKAGRDPYARKRRDSDVIAQWRQRMGTEVAQQQYRRRAPVAEGVHAQQANRGWRRFRLRGLAKVRTEAWWQALTHNVMRLLAWGVALAGTVRPQAA
jgi:transposase